MDDIDKVRDDLQSTKQLLALELRNKEAQIRENKKLLARIQNLEAELEKERAAPKDTSKQNGNGSEADDKVIRTKVNIEKIQIWIENSNLKSDLGRNRTRVTRSLSESLTLTLIAECGVKALGKTTGRGVIVPRLRSIPKMGGSIPPRDFTFLDYFAQLLFRILILKYKTLAYTNYLF